MQTAYFDRQTHVDLITENDLYASYGRENSMISRFCQVE